MAHITRPLLRYLLGAARCVALTGLLCSTLAGCGGGGGSSESDLPVALAEAFGGLVFDSPVKLVQHPEDDDRWYVVEQGGQIWTFLASDPVNTLELSLDLVVDEGIDLGVEPEQGLLGLAFDPDFDAANGGELYLAYTDEDAQDSILARFVSADAVGPFTPAADPIVLAIPHPDGNHNGGDIVFGPDDFLYYSMGDGGGSNDPENDAQNRAALLGKVLRIDVLGTPALGEDYAIPSGMGGNPFAGNPFCDAAGVSPVMPAQPCPEVFAYGLRNPWRMSFDMLTGDLWLGDVGQSRREEINRIVSGGNYGWNCNEGDQEGPNLGASCDGIAFVAPEVVHGRSDAEAITGGVVYRGTGIPDLYGFYVYGDYSTGNFFAFDADTAGAPSERLDLPGVNVSAFGQDRDGEVYVVSYTGAPSIFKLVPAP